MGTTTNKEENSKPELTNLVDVVEATQQTEEVETAVSSPPDVPEHQQRKQVKRQKPKQKSTVTAVDVRRWLGSCGRCGPFLASYERLESEIDLETAVSNTNGNWLTLDWNPNIRELVYKSYGNRVDIGFYHMDSLCSACGRRFVFHEGEEKRTFRVRLNPEIKR